MPFVQAGDLRMHYEERGSGPQTVLFVHGWTGSWRDWSLVMDRLPRGYRAVAVDLRGAGESDKPAAGYTLEQYSADLLAFAHALNLRQFAIVGHSMGGTIAYRFAIDHQDLLRAAVFCAPAAAGGYEGWSEEAIADIRTNRSKREHVVRNSRESFIRPVPDEVVWFTADAYQAASDGHVFDSIDALRDARLYDRLPGIRLPALFVGADRDEAIPVDMLVADWKQVPGAHLHVFHRSGHSFPLELPDDFTRTLVEFLDSVTIRAAT